LAPELFCETDFLPKKSFFFNFAFLPSSLKTIRNHLLLNISRYWSEKMRNWGNGVHFNFGRERRNDIFLWKLKTFFAFSDLQMTSRLYAGRGQRFCAILLKAWRWDRGSEIVHFCFYFPTQYWISIIWSIKEDDQAPAIINLAWLWHHFHLALDGDRTRDLPIVSQVLYR